MENIMINSKIKYKIINLIILLFFHICKILLFIKYILAKIQKILHKYN
jgi:hypothetical protein